MKDGLHKRVIALLGPTGVGKTALGMVLAKDFDAEICSCDSRQIYRYMDIGTGKPTRQERLEVTHWLVDILDPDKRYSAYKFSEDAYSVIKECAIRGKTTIVCGGTGFYFNSICQGREPLLPSDPAFEDRYQTRARDLGNDAIMEELRSVDPLTAGRLHVNDIRRIIRALHVYYATGKPLSDFREKEPFPDLSFLVIICTRAREKLYELINKRVDAMIGAGLWEEFKSLRLLGFDLSDPGMHCVGYQELFGVEQGKIGLDTAIEQVKQHSRNYAKRQLTWFNNKTRGVWINLDEKGSYTEASGLIADFLSR